MELQFALSTKRALISVEAARPKKQNNTCIKYQHHNVNIHVLCRAHFMIGYLSSVRFTKHTPGGLMLNHVKR